MMGNPVQYVIANTLPKFATAAELSYVKFPLFTFHRNHSKPYSIARVRALGSIAPYCTLTQLPVRLAHCMITTLTSTVEELPHGPHLLSPRLEGGRY